MDRIGGIAGRILDRTADKAHFGCQYHRLGHHLGRRTEAVFQIGADRQVRGPGDSGGIGQHLLPRERCE